MHARDHSYASHAACAHFEEVGVPLQVDAWFSRTKPAPAPAPAPAPVPAAPNNVAPRRSIYDKLTGRNKTPVPTTTPAPSSAPAGTPASSAQPDAPAYSTTLVPQSNAARLLRGCKWGVLTTNGHNQYIRIKDIGRLIGDPLEGHLCPFDTSYAVTLVESRNEDIDVDVTGWIPHEIRNSDILNYMVSPADYFAVHNAGKPTPDWSSIPTTVTSSATVASLNPYIVRNSLQLHMLELNEVY